MRPQNPRSTRRAKQSSGTAHHNRTSVHAALKPRTTAVHGDHNGIRLRSRNPVDVLLPPRSTWTQRVAQSRFYTSAQGVGATPASSPKGAPKGGDTPYVQMPCFAQNATPRTPRAPPTPMVQGPVSLKAPRRAGRAQTQLGWVLLVLGAMLKLSWNPSAGC